MNKNETTPMSALLNCLPQQGEVRWIGVRPARGEPMLGVVQVEARLRTGLVGDRYQGRSGKREVTLIQWEHLAAVASMLGIEALEPAPLRRNIAVSGINLLALRHQQFQIGDAVLQGVDLCHPCSKMEAALGPGGYNAMRGHGGLTAKVIRPGIIRIGDAVQMLTAIPDL